jgi:cbb3-type cytochrome c oxidase subunit III
MKLWIRASVVTLLALGLAAFAASCQKKPESKPVSADSTSATYKAEPAPAGVAVNITGERAFLAYCAMCHGDGGTGDGPLAQELAKLAGSQPINLTDETRIKALGREGVRNTVIRGGAHTGKSNLMPAWGEKLEPALVDSIVDYVVSLPLLHPTVPTSTVEKYLAAPPGTAVNGRRWFVYYCSGCHGSAGKGDGPTADRLRREHNIRPRDLTNTEYFAPKTDQELYATIALGGGHAGKSAFMPAWTYSLRPEQIKDLVSYIRSLSNTPSK